MKRRLSHFFLLLGVLSILFAGYLYYQRFNPSRVAFAMDTVASATNTAEDERMPAYLRIPSLGIQLQIHQAHIVDNKWDARTDGVSYLTSSPPPGVTGNSIIYGHNFPNLLGELPKIKPGDTIEIGFNNYTQETFVVETIAIVSPQETGVLLPSLDKRLTLYTCTGFLDLKRFVVIAKLK